MSMKNTFRNMSKPDGYEDYVSALMAYKNACSVYKKLINRLRDMNDPASRLEKADAKDIFKQHCKAYNAARLKYVAATARMKLKEKGIDIDAIALARAVGIEVPVTMKAMMDEHRRQAAVSNMSDEQFELIKRTALNYESGHINDPRRTKNTFLEHNEFSPEKDPTLGDFDGLD